MANRNIDESLRKPRRARGTPFHASRNYYALGVIAAGGVCWALFELWPEARKLKKAQLYEGKFGTPESVETVFLQKGLSTTNASYAHLLKELRDRADAREDALYHDESKPQPCTPKISKYFSKVAAEEEDEDAESPYKYVVSKVRSIAFDDSANDDDFKSPPTRMVHLKPPPKVAKKNLPRRSSRRKNPMQRVLEDNFNPSTGMNGDHLQMALALSESSYVTENPENADKSRGAQEKTELFKQALEKFGLRCGGGRPERNPFAAPKPKNPKKSRYRFVTPILKLRTDEERQSLLVSKLTLLLTRNARFEQNCLNTPSTLRQRNLPRTGTVHSDLLRDHLCASFETFHLNSLNADELTEERFYVKNLNLTRPEASTCGCLLKNWTLIPGRDVSPSRDGTEENKTEAHSWPVEATSEAKNWTSMDDGDDGAGDEAVESNERSEASESDHQAIESNRGPVEESEEKSTKESRTSQNEAGLEEEKVEGYRTDSEDLETFAFSNLTDLLRPSPEETELATEQPRCITPDLFDETEDDSSQSLISPLKISPPLNVTLRKKVDQNKSSNIVVVDLTDSTEDEKADCINEEKMSSFIDQKRSSGNLGIEETSHVQFKENYVDYSRSGTSNFEYSITQRRNVETKHSNDEDVIEETQDLDFDATIILSEAERNAHVFTARCSENEDPSDVETPDDLGFDDDCNAKVDNDGDVSKCEADKSNLNRTEDLNVTDYVLHILNNRNSSILRGSSTDGNSSVRTELFPSQESFTVSDDELNYSSALSKSAMKRKVSYELSSSSDSEVDDDEKRSSAVPKSTGGSPASKSAASSVESSPEKAGIVPSSSRTESPPPEPTATASANLLNDILESGVLDKYTTPCSKVLIKTDIVTPMPDYDEMDTPKVTAALDNFGLKPLKRKKGAKKRSSALPKSTGGSPAGKSAASSVESSPEKADIAPKSSRTESPPPEPTPPASANLLNDSLNDILESGVFDKYTTPCSKVLIKTDNVTPMPDYDEMDTPKVTAALDNFGLKPLKRKKGAAFLKYIYESTHPLVEAKLGISSDDEAAAPKVVKKRRIDDNGECARDLEEMEVVVLTQDAGAKDDKGISEEIRAEIEEMQARQHSEPIEILGDKLTADDEELVFERSQSRRVPSCRVPLHIVWHNFVSANPNVRENILLYEPLQLEVLHVMLKQEGYKFNIQDLLTFLDKKCITIRTNPTGSSSNKRIKKKKPL